MSLWGGDLLPIFLNYVPAVGFVSADDKQVARKVLGALGGCIATYIFAEGFALPAWKRWRDKEEWRKLDPALAQAGLILFFVATNGWFMERVWEYYQTDYRREKNEPPSPTTPKLLSPETKSALTPPEPSSNIRGKSLIIHLLRKLTTHSPVPTSRYPSISLHTLMTLTTLLLEFVQVISYPIRDLLRSPTFVASLTDPAYASSPTVGFVHFIANIANGVAGTGLGGGHDSGFLENVRFVVAWWCVVAGWCAVLLVEFGVLLWGWAMDARLPRVRRNVGSGRWIAGFLPLVNIGYLSVMGSFVQPLGCLSDNITPNWPPTSINEYDVARQARLYRCLPIHDGNPPLQTWFPLAGYSMGTAHEPFVTPGTILYTSRSEFVTKNALLALLLLYLLIPTQSTVVIRGTLAAIVMLIMVFYNAAVGSCYVTSVNRVRTIGFLWGWWMVVVATRYTDPSSTAAFDPTTLFTTIGFGWLTLLLISLGLFLIPVRKIAKRLGYDTASLFPASPVTSTPTLNKKEEEVCIHSENMIGTTDRRGRPFSTDTASILSTETTSTYLSDGGIPPVPALPAHHRAPLRGPRPLPTFPSQQAALPVLVSRVPPKAVGKSPSMTDISDIQRMVDQRKEGAAMP
ncbi:hypothetical protein HDV00_001421 [Rhizophlyctis rosea]|nr:hypothetical protein HDV00_001421 [Rhizophlyctis rosea]